MTALRQVEGQLGDAAGTMAPRLQPGIGENLEHRVVLYQDLRRERPDAPATGSRHQMLQQQRRHSPPVGMAGHGERDLRRLRPAGRGVARHAH